MGRVEEQWALQAGFAREQGKLEVHFRHLSGGVVWAVGCTSPKL